MGRPGRPPPRPTTSPGVRHLLSQPRESPPGRGCRKPGASLAERTSRRVAASTPRHAAPVIPSWPGPMRSGSQSCGLAVPERRNGCMPWAARKGRGRKKPQPDQLTGLRHSLGKHSTSWARSAKAKTGLRSSRGQCGQQGARGAELLPRRTDSGTPPRLPSPFPCGDPAAQVATTVVFRFQHPSSRPLGPTISISSLVHPEEPTLTCESGTS